VIPPGEAVSFPATASVTFMELRQLACQDRDARDYAAYFGITSLIINNIRALSGGVSEARFSTEKSFPLTRRLITYLKR